MAFAGLHQLLRPVLSHSAELPSRQRDALLAAFGMTEAAAPDPYLIALASLELLSLVATENPLLAVIDDVHWLDPPSAEAMAFVVRRLAQDPVGLVVCAREGYRTPFDVLELEALGLGPLDRGASETVLDECAPALGAQRRARILGQAGGNPLALIELASAPEQDRALETTPLGEFPITARLEAAFSSRYEELPVTTRTLLLLAAASDDERLTDVMAAGALIIPGTRMELDAVTPGIDAGLVTVHGTAVRFRHPLVRSAIYQSATLEQRQSAHTALADVLEEETDRRAWHRAAATFHPDEDVASEVEAAANRAEARGARRITLDALERCAQLTPDAGRRADRLLRAAELALSLGDPLAATRLEGQVDGHALRTPASAGRLSLLREMLAPVPADPTASANALIDLADQMDSLGETELALRFAHLAAVRTWVSDVSESVRGRLLTCAERIAPSPTSPLLLSIYSQTDPDGHSAILIERTDTISVRDVDADTACLLGAALNVAGAFGRSAGFLASAASQLRDEGRLGVLVEVLAHQAWTAFATMNRVVVMPAAEEGVRLARETDQPVWEASSLMVMGILAGVEGDSERSDALIAESEAIALPMAASAMLCGIQLSRGLSAIAGGRYDDAFAQLSRAFDPTDPAFHHFQSAWALGDLAEAALHSGNIDAARDQVAIAEARRPAVAATWTQIGLLYARPFVAEDSEAEDHFRASLSSDLSSWPLYRARLLLAYGRWLRRQRRSVDSRAPLRAAREAFDALGARAFAEQARMELRAAGERSSEQEVKVWQVLSPQELHIATMAAEGLTNREIGARLFLSHRTVGSHLYRLYPKLDITSRSQLREALHDLVRQPPEGVVEQPG